MPATNNLTNEYSKRCLQEIQRVATECDDELKPLNDDFRQGGCLILGNCYARSHYIYCGINPGGDPGEFDSEICSGAPFNMPFRNDPDDEISRRPYFRNCQTFLREHPRLDQWFNDRVTSAFVVPWRTKKSKFLWGLNSRTDRKLFKSSGKIFKKMIEHHQAKLIVLGGVESIFLLNSIMGNHGCKVEPDPKDRTSQGPGGIYQWSRTCLIGPSFHIPVLQIPHFSWACSPRMMHDCAVWLCDQLQEFGLSDC